MHIPSLEIFSIMWNFPSQCLSSKGNSRDWLCLVWKSTNERMDPLWRFNMQLFGTLLYTIWRLFSTLRLKEFGPTFYFREEVHAFRHIKVVLENTLHIISCKISVLFGTFFFAQCFKILLLRWCFSLNFMSFDQRSRSNCLFILCVVYSISFDPFLDG